MKKLFSLFVFSLFTVGMTSLILAAPVGNPASPKLLSSAWVISEGYSIKAGSEIDLVFDEDLKDMDDSELNFYGGTITLTLADMMDVYTTLGVANGEFVETDAGDKVTWETDTAFAWCVGGKALVGQFENGIMVGIDGKYRQTNPDVDKLIVNSTEYSIPSGDVTNVNIDFKEWQIALGAAYQIDKFIPYGGIKYSEVDAEMKATVSGTTYTSDSAHRKNNVGIFLGCDLILLESIALNVEGRFIDEQAVNVGATVKF